MNRRVFVQKSAAAAALSALAIHGSSCRIASEDGIRHSSVPGFEFDAYSIQDLHQGLRRRKFSVRELTSAFLKRMDSIDSKGPKLKSVLCVNPDALEQANALDEELRRSGPRGPLHGIPILIKDNINTHDRMPTTAGSLALAASFPEQDATLVTRLREAGAVILGKTNLSEWANFRGSRSISGWSGVGGQTRNPHVLDRSPSGSSSGSACAVAASLCAAAVGTETDGSIISPSSFCGVVGLKPTVGLISRSGIIPISSSQDTAGPMARTVSDAAWLLDFLAGRDSKDLATSAIPSGESSGYASSLIGASLKGMRIGVARRYFGFHPGVDEVMETGLRALKREGAELVDPIEVPDNSGLGDAEYQVMLFEFKAGLNAYLASLPSNAPVRSLDQLIAFNLSHSERELCFFGQQTLIAAAAKAGLDDPKYIEARQRCVRWSKDEGIDALLQKYKLDAITAPSGGPAHTLDHLTGDRWLGGSSTLAAVAGYPAITVPCGNVFGLPVGISFFSGAWKERTLLRMAHAFEQASRARQAPRLLPTLDLGNRV